jgi:hypothetical protein
LTKNGPVFFIREQLEFLVTDMARVFFGFVLQKSIQTTFFIDSPLKQVVGEIAAVIYRVSIDEISLFLASCRNHC